MLSSPADIVSHGSAAAQSDLCWQRQRRRHWEMIVIAGLVIVLAPLLDVLPDQRVAFHGLGRLPLPGTCLSRELLDVSCPGCGLTRSIAMLAHADLRGSFHMHRLGWLMAMAIVLQIPYRIACLRYRRPPLGDRVPKYFGNTVIFLLIVNWVTGWLI